MIDREATMAKVFAMYGKPKDPVAFDRYYHDTHVPIAKRLPGLRAYEITRGGVSTPAGTAPWHLIAVLTFDSTAAVQAALASAEGQATVADLANFATGGVEVFIAETAAI
jgi:uncharacterized protein (TIGR02118 family)